MMATTSENKPTATSTSQHEIFKRQEQMKQKIRKDQAASRQHQKSKRKDNDEQKVEIVVE